MAEKDFVIDNFDVLHNAGYSKQAIEIIQKFGMQQNITNAGYRNYRCDVRIAFFGREI